MREKQIRKENPLAIKKGRPDQPHRSKFLVFGVLLSAFLPIFAQPGFMSESPRKGKEVFREKGCTECHAVYGEGGRGGPDLGRHKFYGTYLELSALMWNHFPKMFKTMRKVGFPFPKFESREMAKLVAYLSFIRYLGEPGGEFRGRKLLKSKGCISCHKFGGAGGDLGPDISAKKEYLSPLRLVESMWNHGPKMMELFQEKNIVRPVFENDEMVDLVSGIQSFMSPTRVSIGSFDLGDPEKGEIIVEEKGCMRCHSLHGVGGALGPDFAEMELNLSVTQMAGRMWNHGPRMWEIMKAEGFSFPVFEPGEMADVLAYLYELKMQDPPGDPEEGKRIILEKGCLSCHSLKGQGTGMAADLGNLSGLDSPMAMITAMWNHAPGMEKKHREVDLEWPRLDGKEMGDLFAYLATF